MAMTAILINPNLSISALFIPIRRYYDKENL